MRISLQFFAHSGGDVGFQGGTFVPPTPDLLPPHNPFTDFINFIGWKPDGARPSFPDPLVDLFGWIGRRSGDLISRIPDISDIIPSPGSVDVNSSSNSASGATEPGKEFDNLDPSAWAQLIEDYFDRVEDYNLAAESRANAFSSAEAQKARDWSERMNSTAYQRTVADLKKAGINPMALFYGKASPVGNFSSSAASATSLSMAQPNFSAASSVSSALLSAISGSFKSLLDVLSSLVSRGLKS